MAVDALTRRGDSPSSNVELTLRHLGMYRAARYDRPVVLASSIRDSSNMLRRRPYRSNTCTPSSFSMMSKQQVASSQMAW